MDVESTAICTNMQRLLCKEFYFSEKVMNLIMNLRGWFYESRWNIPPFILHLQQGQQSTNLLSTSLLMAMIINNGVLRGMPYTSAVMEYLCIINQRLKAKEGAHFI